MRRFVLVCLVFLLASFVLTGCTSKQDGFSVSDGSTISAIKNTSTGAPTPELVVDSQPPESNITITESIVPPPTNDTTQVITADTKFPELPKFDFSNKIDDSGRLMVYLFYFPECSACQNVTPEIENLAIKYNRTVRLEKFDLSTLNGSYAYQDYVSQYSLNRSLLMVPQILVNGTIITDRFNIHDKLEPMILAYSK